MGVGTAPGGSAFSTRTVALLVVVGVASLAVWIAFVVYDPDVGEPTSSGADGYSRSAIGHRAFIELLRELGIPVVMSRYQSGQRAGNSAVLVVAEPSADADARRKLEEMVAAAHKVVLVLPKWQGEDDADRPGWVRRVELVAPGTVEGVLRAAGVPATIIWTPADGCEAVLRAPAQLLDAAATGMRPLVTCAAGVLVAEFTSPSGRRLLVVSDPDVLANHGLAAGDNANVAYETVEHLRRRGEAVLVDETLHGHEKIPSVWRDVLRFPQGLAVLQAALALATFIAAGVGRFGAPVPRAAPLPPGKTMLIENTAELLERGRHTSYAVARYFDTTVADVARTLHVGPEKAAEMRTRLDRIATSRALEPVGALEADVARTDDYDDAAVAVARRIHEWKRGMVRGARRDTGG
jgi:uncharacterized protein DUF4350